MLTMAGAGILMELKIVGHTQKSRIGPGADAALRWGKLKLKLKLTSWQLSDT